MIENNYKKFLFLCLVCLLSVFSFTIVIGADAPVPRLEIEYPKIADYTLDVNSKLPDLAIYLFHAGMAIGLIVVVISLSVAGVIYAIAPAAQLVQVRMDAKDRIFGSIAGLLILITTYLMITTINPELAIFKSQKLEETKIPEVKEIKIPGVYFYKDKNCDDKTVKPSLSNILDFGDLKNRINSAKIVADNSSMDSIENTSFISIMYKNPSLYGDCRYISPLEECEPNIKPIFSSAAIYKYDFNPKDDTSVFFFRKPCIPQNLYSSIDDIINYCKNPNVGGGWREITKAEINGLHSRKLKDIKFIGRIENTSFGEQRPPDPDTSCNVPEEEKDCGMYDGNDKCISRKCPSLSGENISSIIIKGSYLVIFHKDKGRQNNRPSYEDMGDCQEFPKTDDANKWGPKQVKWEHYRNTSNPVADTVFILPVKY